MFKLILEHLWIDFLEFLSMTFSHQESDEQNAFRRLESEQFLCAPCQSIIFSEKNLLDGHSASNDALYDAIRAIPLNCSLSNLKSVSMNYGWFRLNYLNRLYYIVIDF